ncbi:MAG: hypothetical protein ACRC2N_12620, partial [Aeromonas sp.]
MERRASSLLSLVPLGADVIFCYDLQQLKFSHTAIKTRSAMKVGIIGAMEQEVALLRSQMSNPT